MKFYIMLNNRLTIYARNESEKKSNTFGKALENICDQKEITLMAS